MDIKFDDLKYLAVDLPEDIKNERYSGNFDAEKKLIEFRLNDPLTPEIMKRRLAVEIKNLEYLEICYTVPKEKALAMIREKIADFTEEEFEELHIAGKMDWIYINGQRMYLRSFCSNLFNMYQDLRDRAGIEPWDTSNDNNAAAVKKAKETGDNKAHIHIRHELFLKDEAVKEGAALRAYLPVPVQRDQIQNLHIISISPEPKQMPVVTDPHPAAYFEEKAAKGMKFSVEYEFDSVMKYCDTDAMDLDAVAKAEIPEEARQYLGEDMPHINFTAYLRRLTEEVVGKETNPLLIAKKIYDYVTLNIVYRYVREYSAIESIADYCARVGKGDCGVQALMFITMCRIAGVPAKWQSGIYAEPGDIGAHDWAQFYVPSVGWLFADLSFGGSAHKKGDEERRKFYFGNMDPFRIPINNQFQKDFNPPKKHWRNDPCDNQYGEIEYEDEFLSELNFYHKYTDLGIKLI